MTTANFHPSDDILRDFAQGNVTTGMSVALSAHIELCSSCRTRSSELESESIMEWLKLEGDSEPDFSGMIDSHYSVATTDNRASDQLCPSEFRRFGRFRDPHA
jgi:anti-sigma factor ChrR (cupin superfamily)